MVRASDLTTGLSCRAANHARTYPVPSIRLFAAAHGGCHGHVGARPTLLEGGRRQCFEIMPPPSWPRAANEGCSVRGVDAQAVWLACSPGWKTEAPDAGRKLPRLLHRIGGGLRSLSVEKQRLGRVESALRACGC